VVTSNPKPENTTPSLPPITKYLNNSFVTIYNEDCLVGMGQKIEASSVDVVVTSPPYNLGINYNVYKDRMDRSSYIAWTVDWASATYEILKADGSLFLNMGSKPTDPWVSYDVLDVMRGMFQLQNVIHWVKSISIGDEPAKGHIKPINSARFLNDGHEFVFHLTKTGDVPIDKLSIGVPYADVANLARGNRGKNGNIRDRGNIWFIPYDTIQSREKDRPHPATFPLDLPTRCIKLHGVERTRLVVDPFMGLGTTAKAAASLGVNFIGFEIDPYYIEVALERLNDS
jgi:site-specific DNA-methyltransferase (adenine-specific)